MKNNSFLKERAERPLSREDIVGELYTITNIMTATLDGAKKLYSKLPYSNADYSELLYLIMILQAQRKNLELEFLTVLKKYS